MHLALQSGRHSPGVRSSCSNHEARAPKRGPANVSVIHVNQHQTPCQLAKSMLRGGWWWGGEMIGLWAGIINVRNGLHWRDERYIQVIRTGQNILELSLPCLNKSTALVGLFPERPESGHNWKIARCLKPIIKDTRTLLWNVVTSRSAVFVQGGDHGHSKKRAETWSSTQSNFV